MTLPSTVVPKYDGTSVTNVWRLRGRLVRNLAQVSGFQRPWDRDPMVLGSSRAGWVAVTFFLVLAVVGIVLALVRYRTRDLHLAAYALGAFVIGGSFRSPINRYVCTVAPVLMLLALVALYTIVGRLSRPWVATLALSLALGAIFAGNVANAHLRIESATRSHDQGAIEWGPTHPDAIAMFDAVEQLTQPGRHRRLAQGAGDGARDRPAVDPGRRLAPDPARRGHQPDRRRTRQQRRRRAHQRPRPIHGSLGNPRFVLFRPV